MIRTAAPKLRTLAILVGAALFAAVASRRADILLLAAPLAAYLALGLGAAREPALELSSRLASDRTIEGDAVELAAHVTSEEPVAWLEVAAPLPPRVDPIGPRVCAGRLDRGSELSFALSLRPRRWGVCRIGALAVRCRDAYGLWSFEALLGEHTTLRVLPRPESLGRFVEPVATRGFSGGHVARASGSGIEFAALRPYVPGDPAAAIAWRASARRNTLLVAERHPERSADVILFLDTFAPVGADAGGTLADAVRAAAALAAAGLEQHDRVGLVAFGGVLKWLVPAGGERQLYRIIDTLLESEDVLSYAWKGIEIIPRRSLPPGALVIAVTPLVDPRSQVALLDLRRRGFDVSILEVSPLVHVHADRRDAFADLALRLWQLRRATLRSRYRESGMAVAEWSPPAPLDAAIGEVMTFRRFARTAPA